MIEDLTDCSIWSFAPNAIVDFIGNNIMGCWNVTCSGSGLPIRRDDEIVMIYVAKYGGYQDKVTMNFGGNWIPIGFPIFGTYNEVGHIETSEDDFGYKFVTNDLMQLLAPAIKPTYSYEQGGFHSFKKECINGLQPLPDEWIRYLTKRRNVYTSKQRNGVEVFELTESNGSQITQIYYHRKIWDTMLQSITDPFFTDETSQIKKFIDGYKQKCDGFQSSKHGEMFKDHVSYDNMRMFYSLIWPIEQYDDYFTSRMINLRDYSNGDFLFSEVRDYIMKKVGEYLNDPTDDGYLQIEQYLRNCMLLMRLFETKERYNNDFTPVTHIVREGYDLEFVLTHLQLMDVMKQIHVDWIRNYLSYDYEPISQEDDTAEFWDDLVDQSFSDDARKQLIKKYLNKTL